MIEWNECRKTKDCCKSCIEGTTCIIYLWWRCCHIKNKYISTVTFAVLFLFTSFIFPQIPKADRIDKREKVLLGKTVIIHTNDIHGRVLYGQNRSVGMKAVAALKEKCIDEGAKVILLDAGDTLCGSRIANDRQGRTIVELMNAVGYDAMVCGNHDFEYGYQHLATLSTQMNFPLLGANVVGLTDSSCILQDHMLIEKNGITFGIFGLVTKATMTINKEEDVAGILVLNPVDVAKIQVEKLRTKGADVIIALCHLGIKEKMQVDSIELIKKVKGIDILIDGHSHSTLQDCIEANPSSDVLYVSTGSHLRAIGVIVIDENQKMKAYEMTELKLYKSGIEAELVGGSEASPYLLKINEILEGKVQQ